MREMRSRDDAGGMANGNISHFEIKLYVESKRDTTSLID